MSEDTSHTDLENKIALLELEVAKYKQMYFEAEAREGALIRHLGEIRELATHSIDSND